MARWRRIAAAALLIMAVTVRNISEKIESISGNTTVTEPGSAALGDAMLAMCVYDSGGTLTRPTGWTFLFSGTQGTVKWDVCYIIRGASAPSLVWTMTGGTIYREVYIVCCQTSGGTITLDSQSAAGASGNSLSHLPDPPATNAVATSSLALAGGLNFAANSTWTMPAGYTLRTTNASASDGIVASKALSGAGSENPAAFGQSPVGFTGDWWEGFTVTFTDVAAGLTAAQEVPIFAQQLSGLMIGQMWK